MSLRSTLVLGYYKKLGVRSVLQLQSLSFAPKFAFRDMEND
jgi:hypothetical protein